jgi:hypothetical protein
MKIRQGVLTLVAISAAGTVFGQTNIQIIKVVPTFEQAIQLTWTSISNEVYAVDAADQLVDISSGGTVWNRLYDNYPSHGTNTFWLDTGNYNFSPQIVHPKNSATRFYRVVDLGPDTTSTEPTVSITSPTNGFIASGMLTVTVSASTDQATLYKKLYIDGQEICTLGRIYVWIS